MVLFSLLAILSSSACISIGKQQVQHSGPHGPCELSLLHCYGFCRGIDHAQHSSRSQVIGFLVFDAHDMPTSCALY